MKSEKFARCGHYAEDSKDFIAIHGCDTRVDAVQPPITRAWRYRFTDCRKAFRVSSNLVG